MVDRQQATEDTSSFNDAYTNDDLHSDATIHQNIHQLTGASKEACFLCVLDPQHHCTTPVLEGRILAAHERPIQGDMLPFVTLEVGDTLASIALTHYYSGLVKGLMALGKETIRHSKLRLRLYHLPTAPTRSDYKGQPLLNYQANTYTLATLEPDLLLNITDLSQAEYCARQYLLGRLVDSPSSAETVRGNVVHYAFKELLKEHDPAKFLHGQVTEEQTSPLDSLYRHAQESLEQQRIEMALANISVEAVQNDIVPHLESLATWFENQRATLWDLPTSSNSSGKEDVENNSESSPGAIQSNQVRAEPFLLAPEIGLRGRLDLFWQQPERQSLLELKTGGGTHSIPKSSHRWQVQGYHSLLTVRRHANMKKASATLLYSGTPQEAQSVGIPFSVRDLHKVIETRNKLTLSHATGIPPAPPGASRCTKCAMLNQCTLVSSVLDWQPPITETSVSSQSNRPDYNPLSVSATTSTQADQDLTPVPPSVPVLTAEDRTFFKKFYDLLQIEGREVEQQRALLWKEDVEARAKRGAVIKIVAPLDEPELTSKKEWHQTFRCDNHSELRQGDEILLSDGDPITGAVVTGTIVAISADQVTVWTPELIAQPKLIDRYDNDIIHKRTMQNLLRWLQADSHLRELVLGTKRPRFSNIPSVRRADFNDEQNLAVERALQMQDYLLIQGPPGTGKTSVIAEIVKRLYQRGERVLLAAFTNQAVDNMLIRLAEKEDFHDYVRLGNDRGIQDEDVKNHLLKHLVDTQSPTEQEIPMTVHEILANMPVVASTTATWSSNKYTPTTLSEVKGNHVQTPFQFDVAVIDEASQLTTPALLGALRFAKRFILVGDEMQLPPLVMSKEAGRQGLSESLFSFLKQLDNGQTTNQEEAESACVSLQVQYRMNKWIANFSSKIFYEGKLKAADAIADRVIELKEFTAEKPADNQTLQQLAITGAIMPARPLVFLDVRSEEDSGVLKASNAEARAVRAVVQELLAQGIAQENIGIIAPYRAQVANLRHHLFTADSQTHWTALPTNTLISVDTVDRFQGGERMVIIISFATPQTPGLESPLREFLTNPNRLNVALTRAQRKLILVGCAPALEGLPHLSRLLVYCKNMKTLITYGE